MKTAFVITSAVMGSYSVYDPKTRLEQTIATINSVKERLPEAHITIVECSVPPCSQEMKDELKAHCDRLVEFGRDPTVAGIMAAYKVQDVVKSLTELTVLYKFFKIADERKWYDGFDRVFKLSGRYVLNDKFDISKYDNVKDKYVVSKKMLSQFPASVTGGVKLQYMLRLYSLDASLIQQFNGVLADMIAFLLERVRKGGYIDVEHLFMKFLPQKQVVELELTGVQGNIAPNGQWIEN